MFKQFQKASRFAMLTVFISTLFQWPSYAQFSENRMSSLPSPGQMLALSHGFTRSSLVGLSINPANALQFDFLIQQGDQALSRGEKNKEYAKLVRYFLASLTIPDQDQWVNLSPYEKNRMIKENFGQTEMGRDLLAQDYILKQMTSSLIYPEKNLGKKFWQKVYERAFKEYGARDIPVNTFNKVWIIPDEAVVYESGNTVYVLRNHLKVMLEEDYLSLFKHQMIPPENVPLSRLSSSQIVREIILPALEKEVNEGKNFANLRQIYSGMILATWYKHALKESLLGKIYANQNKTQGVSYQHKKGELEPNQIYQLYLKAFKKGVFNYIKEDVDKYTHQPIARKYFSGGAKAFKKFKRPNSAMTGFSDAAVLVVSKKNIGLLSPDVRRKLKAPQFRRIDRAMVDLKEPAGSQKIMSKNFAMISDAQKRIIQDLLEKEKLLSSTQDKTIGLERIRDYFQYLNQLFTDRLNGVQYFLVNESKPFLIDSLRRVLTKDFSLSLFQFLVSNQDLNISIQLAGFLKDEVSVRTKNEFERFTTPSLTEDLNKIGGDLKRFILPIKSLEVFLLSQSWQGIAVIEDSKGSPILAINRGEGIVYEWMTPKDKTFKKLIPGEVVENGDFKIENLLQGGLKITNRSGAEIQVNYLENQKRTFVFPDLLELKKGNADLDYLWGKKNQFRVFDGLIQAINQWLDPSKEPDNSVIRQKNGVTSLMITPESPLFKDVLLDKMGAGSVHTIGFYDVMRFLNFLKTNKNQKIEVINLERHSKDVWLIGLKITDTPISLDQTLDDRVLKCRQAIENGDLDTAGGMLMQLRANPQENSKLIQEISERYWEKKLLEGEKALERLDFSKAEEMLVEMKKDIKYSGINYVRLDQAYKVKMVQDLLEYLEKEGHDEFVVSNSYFFRKYRMPLSYQRFISLVNLPSNKWTAWPVPTFKDIPNHLVIDGKPKSFEDWTVNIYRTFDLRSSRSPAMNTSVKKLDSRSLGGIDLNSANMNLQIKRDGKGVPLPLALQDMAQISGIRGFVPVIIDIKPVGHLAIFSEIQQKLQALTP